MMPPVLLEHLGGGDVRALVPTRIGASILEGAELLAGSDLYECYRRCGGIDPAGDLEPAWGELDEESKQRWMEAADDASAVLLRQLGLVEPLSHAKPSTRQRRRRRTNVMPTAADLDALLSKMPSKRPARTTQSRKGRRSP